MSESGSKRIGASNNSDQAHLPASDVKMLEASSPDDRRSPTSGTKLTDGMSDMHLLGIAEDRRKDEYDVDFEDTRSFAASRWGDILKTTGEKLSVPDLQRASKFTNMEDLLEEIHGKLDDAASGAARSTQLARIQPLPRILGALTRKFASLLYPLETRFDLVWGLIYLNLKLSYGSPDRLKWTTDLLYKLRTVVLLFNQCLEGCEQVNEALLATVDFLDPLALILIDSISYLHKCLPETSTEQGCPDLIDDIQSQIGELNRIVKHVNDITSYSNVDQERHIKNMSLRHTLTPDNEESAIFPVKSLPFVQNRRFYGREPELEKIDRYLSPKNGQSLRTYTIYGRRGVGKTEIALQFAHLNRSQFDAIFWIQCETSVSIRQSFTRIALALNLPSAGKDGHDEENLLAVQRWLKKTKNRWLLIFDNAERDQILKGYWPIGAAGAILITSRKYYNFSKDLKRKGDTIKPFDPKQSWDLLFQLLGNDYEESRLPASELSAAREIIENLEGLALAIQQTAILIKDPEIGGRTISGCLELYKEKSRTLPERHLTARSSTEKSLDVIWDVTFTSLTRNARALLDVLAWLSPDNIPIQLFLPKNQNALDGLLSFCKQDPTGTQNEDLVPLPSVELEKSMHELVARELITKDGRVLSIHRMIQEAVNYHDVEDLQESFNTASRLVNEQFPQLHMESFGNQWNICQEYIPHAIYLSKYSEYAASLVSKGAPMVLNADDTLLTLLSNCAWYLYEIGDYEMCGRVVATAIGACKDKTSLLYAQLLDIDGSRLYDLNRLSECRKQWEKVLHIRKQHLPDNDTFIAGMYNNLGNLETASGNLAESRDYFDRATTIWKAGGDTTASHLALTYLSVGRMHMLRGYYDEALRVTDLSKSLFLQLEASSLSMAHVYLAYGNIEFRQRRWDAAYESSQKCLHIAEKDMPLHPLRAAAYYGLACVEFAREPPHAEVAKAYLDKARQIAELRSPTRDDGVIARILWKTAVVLESDELGRYSSDADELRKRAEIARETLLASGEGGLIPFVGEDGAERDKEKDSFDALVPLFYR